MGVGLNPTLLAYTEPRHHSNKACQCGCLQSQPASWSRKRPDGRNSIQFNATLLAFKTAFVFFIVKY